MRFLSIIFIDVQSCSIDVPRCSKMLIKHQQGCNADTSFPNLRPSDPNKPAPSPQRRNGREYGLKCKYPFEHNKTSCLSAFLTGDNQEEFIGSTKNVYWCFRQFSRILSQRSLAFRKYGMFRFPLRRRAFRTPCSASV